MVYFFVTLGILMWTGNYLIQVPIALFWIALSGGMWMSGTIGGADFKVLSINSIYLSIITPNAIAGNFLFIMLFGFHGLLYGILAKIIKTKKEVPFLPIITLTYIVSYVFWTI